MNAFWYAPQGEYCKDHTIIEKDGAFHLFSISGSAGTSWYYSDSESKLSHSVSEDLKNWSFIEHVLPAREEMPPNKYTEGKKWREDKVWAPHCIEHNNKYFMFYTGVEHLELSKGDYYPSWSKHVQRICLATSTDLVTWTRHPEPVFTETQEMTSHPGAALRDPMVMWDRINLRWLMYVTMYTEDYQNAVGVLLSENLYDWSFKQFVYIEPKDSEIITESPFVSEYKGKYYLFVNKGYSVSGSPMGPFPPCIQYLGEQPGWGAGENLIINGKIRRSLVGGGGLILENGTRYGGQIALFDLEFVNNGIRYAPFKQS
jgi:sucrose-6-phosphate hydrolase SacC (GH32 family)